MAFPFVAPFAPWVKAIMREREQNRMISMFKNPYIVLSSGALVLKNTPGVTAEEKTNTLIEILNNPDKVYGAGTTVYRGCIIANNIANEDLSYSRNRTPVGVDFDGKVIYVEGEDGRLVSTPIVEGLEIDTDGANNTTKTARVSVKCFTLKQLEMFEMFFLKPSMNVLIEFGDATILGDQSKVTLDQKQLTVWRNGQINQVTPAKSIHECLIRKDDFRIFQQEFGKYYRSDIKGTISYFENIEKSLGSWDMIAGKVTNYSYTYSEGAYNVSFEVTQANQLSIALPCNPKRKTGAESSKDKKVAIEYLTHDQILDTIAYNLDLEKRILNSLMSRPHPETGIANPEEWIKKETFNFVKIDEDHSDSAVSQNAYVSLRFILHILMNYVLGKDGALIQKTDDADKSGKEGGNAKTFGFTVPSGLIDEKQVEIIPIRIVENIISASEDVIYPNSNLPKMKVVSTKTKNPQGEDNKIVMDKQTIDDGKINKYDIKYGNQRIPNVYHQEEGFKIDEKTNKLCGPILNLPEETVTVVRKDDEGNEETITNQVIVGNALNIFVNFRQVITMWNKEIYRVDFLEKLLSLINRNSYGLFQLVYAPVNENGPATIIDFKFCEAIPDQLSVQTTEDDYYRFNMTPLESNVLDFNFSFEMGNLIAGQTVFNQNKLVNKILEADPNKVKTYDVDGIKIPEAVFKSVDKSTMPNSDGWYTINLIEYQSILAKAKRTIEKNKDLSKGTTIKDEQPKEEKEEGPDKQGLEDFIHEKSLRFITDPKKYVPPSPPPSPNPAPAGAGGVGTVVGSSGTSGTAKKPLPANVTPEIHDFILNLAASVPMDVYDPSFAGMSGAGLSKPNEEKEKKYNALLVGKNKGQIENFASSKNFAGYQGLFAKWYAAGGDTFLQFNAKPGTYWEQLESAYIPYKRIADEIFWGAYNRGLAGFDEGRLRDGIKSISNKTNLINVENVLVTTYNANRGQPASSPGQVIVDILNQVLDNEDTDEAKDIKQRMDAILQGEATLQFDVRKLAYNSALIKIDADENTDPNLKTLSEELIPNTFAIISNPPAEKKGTSTPAGGGGTTGAVQKKPSYAGTTVLIYRDQPFLLDKFGAVIESSKRKSSLAPINVTLTVQGFSGFRCGYCFNITGVPEKFNEDGIFQITNVKHSIGQDGWKTTIEATFNYRRKKQ